MRRCLHEPRLGSIDSSQTSGTALSGRCVGRSHVAACVAVGSKTPCRSRAIQHGVAGSCQTGWTSLATPAALPVHLDANFGVIATEMELEGVLHVTTFAAATCEAQYGPLIPSTAQAPNLTAEGTPEPEVNQALGSCLATPIEAAETEAHEAHQLAQGVVTSRINRAWAYGAGSSSTGAGIGGPMERWDSMLRRIRRRRHLGALVSGHLRGRGNERNDPACSQFKGPPHSSPEQDLQSYQLTESSPTH